MPATNAKALAKVRTLPADIVILQLEDSVAPALKGEARTATLAENKAKGAIRVEGKMVELLHLEQARRLVALAEMIRATG